MLPVMRAVAVIGVPAALAKVFSTGFPLAIAMPALTGAVAMLTAAFTGAVMALPTFFKNDEPNQPTMLSSSSAKPRTRNEGSTGYSSPPISSTDSRWFA